MSKFLIYVTKKMETIFMFRMNVLKNHYLVAILNFLILFGLKIVIAYLNIYYLIRLMNLIVMD